VSSCLLGHAVRWNGSHKRDPDLASVLGRHFEWVPVCPEEELGLGVPRDPIQLEGDPQSPRLISRTTRTDLTAPMQAFARRRVRALQALDLCGYVLKAGSPSCGMERVPVHGRASGRRKQGVGAFARVLMERLPLLPAEEEERLHDARLRENFIERVFAFRRVKDLLETGPSARGLAEFHQRHQLLVLAHSPEHDGRLSRLVAQARGARARVARRYAELFMQALRVPAKHV
jgi:uncharacterized protein YbbK (DUF523 family)